MMMLSRLANAAAALSLAGMLLKLSGALDLPWWLIVAPVSAVLFIVCAIGLGVGALALFILSRALREARAKRTDAPASCERQDGQRNQHATFADRVLTDATRESLARVGDGRTGVRPATNAESGRAQGRHSSAVDLNPKRNTP